MSVWASSPELLAAGGAFGLGALAIAGARDTGGLSILAWPGGSMWRAELVERLPPLTLAGVEALILALTLAFAWRSRRTWPVAAAILQGVGLGALLARLHDSRISGEDLLQLSRATTVIALVLLVAGAALALLRRRRPQ
jgi:asparagine N-glycosylation enzyme membrane subunit Stt3